jgi:hypothetical protein
MPIFHIHIRTGCDLCVDEEGIELPDISAAEDEAIRGARSLMAADIEAGFLRLDQAVLIDDADGRRLRTIAFADVIKITKSEPKALRQADNDKQ